MFCSKFDVIFQFPAHTTGEVLAGHAGSITAANQTHWSAEKNIGLCLHTCACSQTFSIESDGHVSRPPMTDCLIGV